MNKLLLGNVRFYFAQSAFMSNCHYKAYGRLEGKKAFNSKLVLITSAITIVLLVLQVIGLENDNKNILNIVGFLGLLLTGYSLVFELANKEDLSLIMVQHKIVAEKYKTLRDEYQSLIEEIMSNTIPEDILRKKRARLQKTYSLIGENAPTTNYKDYTQAQKGLGIAGMHNEELTWSNAEINRLLPEELRLT